MAHVQILNDKVVAVFGGPQDCEGYAEIADDDPRLFVRAKAARWSDIKAERDRRKIDGGYKVTVGGVDKWFHSDAFSRNQQLGLVLLGASIPPGLQWKTMDGSFVAMTQSLASQVFAAAAAQDMATFTAAETHKAAMEASSDPASYNFSGGWPAIFGG